MKHGISYEKFRELKLWNSIQTEIKESNSITAIKHQTKKDIRLPSN